LALGSGYPSLVAISTSKNKFATLRATFEKKNIDSFISGLLSGKERLSNLPQVPKLKEVNKWDGRDAPKTVKIEDF
jgi:protein disulfide-isomerase A6